MGPLDHSGPDPRPAVRRAETEPAVLGAILFASAPPAETAARPTRGTGNPSVGWNQRSRSLRAIPEQWAPFEGTVLPPSLALRLGSRCFSPSRGETDRAGSGDPFHRPPQTRPSASSHRGCAMTGIPGRPEATTVPSRSNESRKGKAVEQCRTSRAGALRTKGWAPRGRQPWTPAADGHSPLSLQFESFGRLGCSSLVTCPRGTWSIRRSSPHPQSSPTPRGDRRRTALVTPCVHSRANLRARLSRRSFNETGQWEELWAVSPIRPSRLLSSATTPALNHGLRASGVLVRAQHP